MQGGFAKNSRRRVRAAANLYIYIHICIWPSKKVHRAGAGLFESLVTTALRPAAEDGGCVEISEVHGLRIDWLPLDQGR